MLLKDDPVLVKYAKEFCYYGYVLGLFDSPKEKLEELLNLKVIYNPTLGGAVRVTKDTMEINKELTFGDEEWTSSLMYHEFSHFNGIHKDRHSDNSLIKCFQDNLQSTLLKKYKTNFSEVYYLNGEPQYRGDINCPYTYALLGGVLLDEAIAENVSRNMIRLKYNKPRTFKRKVCTFLYPPVEVYSDFTEYELYHSLADKFAKTLFGINNLDELCIEAFKDDFIENLIYQHTESAESYIALYKELSFLGLIIFAENYSKGRTSKDLKPVEPGLVRQIYDEVVKLLDEGVEYRDKIDFDIPQRIENKSPSPSVLKDQITIQQPKEKTKLYLSNGRVYVKKEAILKHDLNVVKPFLEFYGLPQSEFNRVFCGKLNYQIVKVDFPLPPLNIEWGEYNGNIIYRIREEAVASLEYKTTNKAINGYVILTQKEVNDLNAFFTVNLLPLNLMVPSNSTDFGVPGSGFGL